MSKEDDNKAVVVRWFTDFWGKTYDPAVIDEIAAPDMLFKCGGTHTGPAFDDFVVGGLKPATGKSMRFTGTTVLKVVDGKIVEEIGLDDGVAALTQLGLLKAA